MEWKREQVDFYVHTTDLIASNDYGAAVAMSGGSFPGFEMLAFGINNSNGTPHEMKLRKLSFTQFFQVEKLLHSRL